jgi:hypothetical protein
MRREFGKQSERGFTSPGKGEVDPEDRVGVESCIAFNRVNPHPNPPPFWGRG